MEANNHFSLLAFTDTTKKLCNYSSISMFLLVLVFISPLRNIFILSTIMKIITLCLLVYIFYMNIKQTNYLKMAGNTVMTPDVSSQLSMNIICSYVFTLFIGFLIIFVVKNVL